MSMSGGSRSRRIVVSTAGRTLVVLVALALLAMAARSCARPEAKPWYCAGCWKKGCEIWCATPPEVIVREPASKGVDAAR